MRRVISWRIIRPKEVFRLGWGVFLHYKPKAKALTGKKAGLNAQDPSKELLVAAGEMSDGQQNGVQVPRGFLAVYVGPELRRFVIPATYLSMPDFKVLMDRVAEEVGYEQGGGLRIPCEEEEFENILTRCLERKKMMSKGRKKRN